MPIYRLYNPSNGDHLYTAEYGEADALVNDGWVYEGVPFFVTGNGYGVYRLYNPNSGEHLYTADVNEAQQLQDQGWTREGVAFYL